MRPAHEHRSPWLQWGPPVPSGMSSTQSLARQATPETEPDEPPETEEFEPDVPPAPEETEPDEPPDPEDPGPEEPFEEEGTDGKEGEVPPADDGETADAPDELGAGPERTGPPEEPPSAPPRSR